MTTKAIQNLCVQIDVKLVKQIKLKALTEDVSTTQLVEDALKEYLLKHPIKL